ncbi:hypothetical protein JCM9279_006409 [Rhodotorula babjevae]
MLSPPPALTATSRTALGLKSIKFDELVDIAAETDSLPSFKKPDKPAASSSSPSSSKKTSGTESCTVSPSEALASSQKWARSAVDWQKSHPESESTTWLDKTAPAPASELRCFNCGRVGRHFSRSCTSRRVNPEKVLIAMAHVRLMVLDVISPKLVHRLGLDVCRLDSLIHAQLASDNQGVRLSVFAYSTLRVERVKLPKRSFFVAPLPPGIDAILGLPFLRDSKTAVSPNALFFVADRHSASPVYDFTVGAFAVQDDANLLDLGFTRKQMTLGDLDSFIVCALTAGVDPHEVRGLVDRIGIEPHNPLLDDEEDDPALGNWTSDKARSHLDELLEQYADVFVDELPGLPPFCPVNHAIELLDAEKKIKPFAIRMPERFSAQWTAHLRNFVDSGFWSPVALNSACSMFAVPKHDRSQARFVVNLKPRNENTVALASPIPDMGRVRRRLAAHGVRSKLDFKNAYEQVRLEPESVPLSGFVTTSGTFVSLVMQQGDRNPPDTMH